MSRKTFTGKAESVYKSSPTWADFKLFYNLVIQVFQIGVFIFYFVAFGVGTGCADNNALVLAFEAFG